MDMGPQKGPASLPQIQAQLKRIGEDMRAEAERQGVDFDELLEGASKHFGRSLEEIRSAPPPTDEEIQWWADCINATPDEWAPTDWDHGGWYRIMLEWQVVILGCETFENVEFSGPEYRITKYDDREPILPPIEFAWDEDIAAATEALVRFHESNDRGTIGR